MIAHPASGRRFAHASTLSQPTSVFFVRWIPYARSILQPGSLGTLDFHPQQEVIMEIQDDTEALRKLFAEMNPDSGEIESIHKAELSRMRHWR
jgi:hypothetical protein